MRAKGAAPGRFRGQGKTKGRAAQKGKAWGNEGRFRRGLVSGFSEQGCRGKKGAGAFDRVSKGRAGPAICIAPAQSRGLGGAPERFRLFAQPVAMDSKPLKVPNATRSHESRMKVALNPSIRGSR